jgi:trehalose 6-phosphate synthase/trehalose 6-phosphate phosphatase
MRKENTLTLQTSERLDEFFRGFAQGARPLLLLDYDGTLAPFRFEIFSAWCWD